MVAGPPGRTALLPAYLPPILVDELSRSGPSTGPGAGEDLAIGATVSAKS
jgi:hypothetical protein